MWSSCSARCASALRSASSVSRASPGPPTYSCMAGFLALAASSRGRLREAEASIDLGGIGGAIVLAAAGALFLSCRCDLLLSRSRSAASPPQLAAAAKEFFPDAPLLPRAGHFPGRSSRPPEPRKNDYATHPRRCSRSQGRRSPVSARRRSCRAVPSRDLRAPVCVRRLGPCSGGRPQKRRGLVGSCGWLCRGSLVELCARWAGRESCLAEDGGLGPWRGPALLAVGLSGQREAQDGARRRRWRQAARGALRGAGRVARAGQRARRSRRGAPSRRRRHAR